MLQDQPYKNREHVRLRLEDVHWQVASFRFSVSYSLAIGIIGDALSTTLGLTSLSWFMLAIFAVVHAIIPSMHLVMAKNFLGIEAESKKKEAVG